MRASNEWADYADSFASLDEYTHFPSAHAIGIAGRLAGQADSDIDYHVADARDLSLIGEAISTRCWP